MEPHVYYEYYDFNGASFFTLILKPDKKGKFPVVVTRSPYVKHAVEKTEEELAESFKKLNLSWAENNYVLVFQHCRGQGKSTGEFVPYIHEREDGLALREWIRHQDFYDGAMFLTGASYGASLHYSTAPFEKDIKGAVFNVQDSERYRLWYRNGRMRRGHANWHFNLYKDKSDLKKTHTMESFSTFPLNNLSEKVLGERAEDFENMLLAYRIEHPFWNTRFGGNEARDAISSADLPILLSTGYNDFYLGGMFDMWRKMDDKTKAKCAMIVTPYNHGDSYSKENGICFPGASVAELLGSGYHIKWFDSIIKGEKPFIETGKIYYYRAFENKWDYDFYSVPTEDTVISLGDMVKNLAYNPENPPAFNEEGTFMEKPGRREDIITIYTEPAKEDFFVKGKMKMKLTASSDCEDTSFYVMIGIVTEKGDYSLRHDITSILYQKESYIPNEKIVLDFMFDEYAFLVKKGQRLRIDIAPTDKNTYVCHSNKKGEYSLIESTKTAHNKVFLGESFLSLPLEQ